MSRCDRCKWPGPINELNAKLENCQWCGGYQWPGRWSMLKLWRREVVSSSPDRGAIAGRVFSPTGQPVRFSHPNMPFFPNLEFCPRGNALNYRQSAHSLDEAAGHLKTPSILAILLWLQGDRRPLNSRLRISVSNYARLWDFRLVFAARTPTRVARWSVAWRAVSAVSCPSGQSRYSGSCCGHSATSWPLSRSARSCSSAATCTRSSTAAGYDTRRRYVTAQTFQLSSTKMPIFVVHGRSMLRLGYTGVCIFFIYVNICSRAWFTH